MKLQFSPNQLKKIADNGYSISVVGIDEPMVINSDPIIGIATTAKIVEIFENTMLLEEDFIPQEDIAIGYYKPNMHCILIKYCIKSSKKIEFIITVNNVDICYHITFEKI